jgi:hypothetical protein
MNLLNYHAEIRLRRRDCNFLTSKLSRSGMTEQVACRVAKRRKDEASGLDRELWGTSCDSIWRQSREERTAVEEVHRMRPRRRLNCSGRCFYSGRWVMHEFHFQYGNRRIMRRRRDRIFHWSPIAGLSSLQKAHLSQSPGNDSKLLRFYELTDILRVF